MRRNKSSIRDSSGVSYSFAVTGRLPTEGRSGGGTEAFSISTAYKRRQYPFDVTSAVTRGERPEKSEALYMRSTVEECAFCHSLSAMICLSVVACLLSTSVSM